MQVQRRRRARGRMRASVEHGGQRKQRFHSSRDTARTRLAARHGWATADRRRSATTLRLHPVTLRALAAAGTVPAVKIGRAWRFVEVDLLAWARANY